MQVVFCRPSSPQRQRDRFEVEADALEALDLEPVWVSMEAVVDGDLDQALEHVPEGRGLTLLRSWMLREEAYEALYEALAERGTYLQTDPAAYAVTHYLPNALEYIESHTAPTRVMDGTDLDEAWALAQELGAGPRMLKDHVKSAKEAWPCGFVPADCDRAAFRDICAAFIGHRGEHFERGLVIRAMLPFAPLPSDDTVQPCFDEYRLFFCRGRLVAAAPYFESEGAQTDFSRFEWLGERVPSPFFTADVARCTSGRWIVVELGDGGVSTLPPGMDPRAFYEAVLEVTDDGV